MEKRLTFSYGRALILNHSLVFSMLIVLVIVAVAYLPQVPPGFYLLPAVLLGAYFVLFAVSPFLTDHWITRSRLILRQGWYFRVVIPFSEIVGARSADELGPSRTPLGIHRPLGQPTLYVTGGRTGLVFIRLKEPRRFWQAFGLQVTEIVFDVSDPVRFLAAFEERRRLLSPVEPNRADS